MKKFHIMSATPTDEGGLCFRLLMWMGLKVTTDEINGLPAGVDPHVGKVLIAAYTNELKDGSVVANGFFELVDYLKREGLTRL